MQYFPSRMIVNLQLRTNSTTKLSGKEIENTRKVGRGGGGGGENEIKSAAKEQLRHQSSVFFCS